MWNVGECKQLEDLLAQDKSCVEISKELGITKNAVIGKCKRTGLKLEAGKNKRRERQKGNLNGVKKIKVNQPILRVQWQPEEPGPRSCTIWHLNRTKCRWPLWGNDGTPEEKFYCGELPEGESRYCARHRLIYSRGY